MNQELHFNKESFTTKLRFFKKINLSKFSIRYYEALVVNNDWTNEEYIIQSMEINKDIINNCIIYIDGTVSKQHNRLIISKIKTTYNNSLAHFVF